MKFWIFFKNLVTNRCSTICNNKITAWCTMNLLQYNVSTPINNANTEHYAVAIHVSAIAVYAYKSQ